MVRDYALNETNILVFFETCFRHQGGSIFISVSSVFEKKVYSAVGGALFYIYLKS